MAENQDDEKPSVQAGKGKPDPGAVLETGANAIAPDEQAAIERLRAAEAQIAAHPVLGGVESYEEQSAGSAPPRDVKARVKLVLFSDGTGNSSAKAEKTNVWRMFEALGQAAPEQLAMYDDGVGTSRNKYLAALGGAFGWGLKRNVIDLYKFVCRNYVDERTEIYGFGFSRGAFTIRVLAGMITSEGVVHFTSEKQLHERAVEAYALFREKCFHAPVLSPPWMLRWLRKGWRRLAQRARRPPAARSTDIALEFLGLWDTVSAYGMPIAELKPAINWLFWPMNFKGTKLSPKVKRACHALSLDDERTTFHPITWDQSNAADAERISQVWFAGVHSNVGGGYPEDRLSLVSLHWMMEHAQRAGLDLDRAYVDRVARDASPFARIYDSRAGLACFYRYAPRTIRIRGQAGHAVPVIHWSVIMRMVGGCDGYVPNALPSAFEVLAPNADLVPMRGHANGAAAHLALINAVPPRPGPAATATKALLNAMSTLSTPGQANIDPILNTIWWRRIAYFLTASCAALGAAYPLFADSLHAAIRQAADAPPARNAMLEVFRADGAFLLSKIVALDNQFSGIVAGAFDAASSLIPAGLAPWTSAIEDNPAEFALIALGFAACYQLGTWLHWQLRDFKMLAWHAQLRAPFSTARWQAARKRIGVTAALLAAFDLMFLGSLTVSSMAGGHYRFVGLAVVVNALSLARIAWHWRFQRVLRNPARPISAGYFTQLLAHRLRTNRPLHALSGIVRTHLLPLAFGVALVYAGAVALNRAAFDIESAGGAFCTGSVAGGARLPTVTGRVSAASPFATGDLCWASGYRLDAGTRYRVTITALEAWRDDMTPVSAASRPTAPRTWPGRRSSAGGASAGSRRSRTSGPRGTRNSRSIPAGAERTRTRCWWRSSARSTTANCSCT